MDILAKKLEENGNIITTQTLDVHTNYVIEEALKLIDEYSLKKVSEITGFKKNFIEDLIFFSAYFHDIGKATKEFQSTIMDGIQSYHSVYSASTLVNIEDFDFSEEKDRYINLLLIIVLTHHTLLPYTLRNANCSFLKEVSSFFYNYKKSYEYYLERECKYNFNFEINTDMKMELEYIEEDLKYIRRKNELRIIYTYVSGTLNLADWVASAKFTNTINSISFNILPEKNDFLLNLSFDKLKKFQDKLSYNNKSVLVEIPTGEGKTEGALLWAINNIKNRNSKIIYTLPTQTTSNKLYERIQNLFNKKECGLIHSSAKIYLERIYEKENGKIDDTFKSDFLLNKSFNKPVTVSTIDSLLKYFINIGRFNIATKNFLNSVIIIDEVHSYDLKLMGFLKRFLELCKEMNVKVCLMSASIPDKIKELLGIKNYEHITEEKLFEKRANIIVKENNFMSLNFGKIIQKFKENNKILVIRNTVSSAIETYKTLKKMGLSTNDIILFHSTFKKIDREKKENLIFEKLSDNKPFILVATQIVEVSLDIDFDIMFTDNAPIDSLIQRFGRVNRKKLSDRKGEIFIYKTENPLPYKLNILDLTFDSIKNGYFELNEYVKWLNIVYDKLFEEDITVKNEITRLFEDGYNKYDDVIKKLCGIKQSADNYDLRDIGVIKNDYLLYDDYINGRISYEYTISLPLYYEKKYRCEIPEHKINIFYNVLDIDYDFEQGILMESKNDNLFW